MAAEQNKVALLNFNTWNQFDLFSLSNIEITLIFVLLPWPINGRGQEAC